MSEFDRHPSGMLGVSFSEELAYCLYARDAWGIETPVAAQFPRCSPALAALPRPASDLAQTAELESGWDDWWQAALAASLDEVARTPGQPPDEVAGPQVRSVFRALYPQAREWITRCKAEHVRLLQQFTRTPGIRSAVLDLRPGDFHVVSIPVASMFAKMISPDRVLASPGLLGNPPGFLDWLAATGTSA